MTPHRLVKGPRKGTDWLEPDSWASKDELRAWRLIFNGRSIWNVLEKEAHVMAQNLNWLHSMKAGPPGEGETK